MSNDIQPEIRFPGFTEDWEQRKLGDITESFSGGTPTAGKSEYYGGDIPFIRSGEISSELTELFITENGLNNSSAKMVKAGDILYALYGATSGEVSISRINGAINQAILAIRPTKNDNSYLIVQWLRKQKDTIISTYLQGGQGNLSGSIVKDLVITLPQDKEEQNKIGAFFKQLDDTIALHQRKLDLLKETKKGFLQKMFPKNGAKVPEVRFPGFTEDWEQRKLNDFISGDISDGDWIEKEHIKDEGKYRIIQTGNIGNGVYIDKEKSAKYMDQNSFDILKANEIFPGDLLVSRLAEPAGRTVILPNIEDRMVTAVDVAILRQNENFDAYFLLSQMNTSKILNKVSKNVSGTSHKRISRKNLEKVTIDSTSIEEQNKIGAFFKQLDDTIALHQRKLDLLKETKKGFLQKMFV
ncbi:restriction endonuclease subunit S [Enterococcus faecium]|uniref:restriction endonuclease subunit S n=1 Tax=Enterococcus faecium TaxID=1352 RepID=UPI00030662E3|nr:restriction endonuclease subunit S [Enterococcus faecium]KST52004.1 restriction endonuclease subunit S [Enterococcus faecium]MDB7502813.1 restriction endonuclease subunit S [Enterococcus faecium]MDB7507890.1 restriction endonuclease subunit S [Enterococcus faecium]MDQ8307043.1 restriction endonuclease subunit S [Enterococcus faecium]MDQ8312377.1 restriction endonuclease subunit S [Enterococcus faecium]